MYDRRILFLWVSLFFFPVHAATLEGRVVGPTGEPVVEAVVTLVELRLVEITSADGSFRFTDVPQGAYHLQAQRGGLGTAVAEVESGQSDAIELRLDRSLHREKIVVSADRLGSGTRELVQATTVLERDDIVADMEPTIGEMLADEPGVSSTAFGAGAGRPVIRGQQGPRVRVLENGLAVGDASVTSPDHAVGVDPFEAQSIEVVRGPAVLLYGSAASGGVVNVIDGKIPERVPTRPIGGELTLRGNSVSDEQAGSLRLTGGQGQFAWQLGGFSREAEDYEIPGPAIRGEPDSPSSVLPNSFVESDGLSAGISWIGESAFVGIGAKSFDTLYGIPAELEEEEEEIALLGIAAEPEEGISIDLEQRRYDLRAGWNADPSQVVRGLRFDVGVTDYEHVELEGAEVGTQFFNESLDARAELLLGKGTWSGVVGIQGGDRELEAIGAEAFVPPSQSDGLALFTLQRFEDGATRWEFGLRAEEQSSESVGRPDRDFSALSASVGATWEIVDDLRLGANLSRSARFPTVEELYADGPHVATQSFERGDPNLEEETNVGLEVSLRRTAGRFTGYVNFFVNDFDDYIFEAPTGEIEDGLPVFQFAQGDAESYGFEASGTFELIGGDRHHLDVTLTTDLTRAELTSADENLPLIPPRSSALRFDYRSGPWSASASARRVDDQERVASFETTTEDYTLIDASAGYTFGTDGNGRLIHQLLLRGRNLGDEQARVHTSRLKDLILQPGRDVSLSYRLVF